MKEKSYRDQVHSFGRVWMYSALAMLILVPISISVRYNAWPDINQFLKGLMSVLPMFWIVGTIEVITYVPMLGTGGSYLGFVTGNLTNLKVPCALNAMEAAEVKPGTEEGEVISTIAIAISSIVTTLIIAVGVLLLAQIQPLLESPTLKPAFDNILPALFGALAVVYVSKNWKIAVVPLVFMVAVFVFVPGISKGEVGIMVPVGSIIAIAIARLLYKKGLI